MHFLLLFLAQLIEISLEVNQFFGKIQLVIPFIDVLGHQIVNLLIQSLDIPRIR